MNKFLIKMKYFLFGYVKFKAIKNIETIRQKIIEDTKENSEFIYGHSFYKKNYQQFLNHPEIIKNCEILFGEDFKFSNGGTVHHRHYGVKQIGNRLMPIAHIDSDFQYYKKEKEINKLTYQVAKIGIYLQSSEKKLNILALPFTHLLARFLATIKLNKLILIFLKFSSIIFSFELLRKMFRINIEPGDVVIFDCLLIHASDVGESFSEKFVIYSEAGSINSMRNFQLNNIVPRATLEKTSEDNEKIYSRDPNRYSIQKALYDGEINSFKNVIRNLRNE